MKKFLNKIIAIVAIVLAFSATTAFITPDTVSAANGFNGTCRNFLGLTSWDCGVTIQTEDDLKSNIWTIVANIATDITIIAAYLVLGYVIYGGYLYVFSAGDPSKVATGRKTLAQAFIGLAIVMSANVIMGAIRIALVGGSGNIGDCTNSGGCIDPGQMVTNLIQWTIAMAGIAAAIFVVYGGISYITSQGDPGKLQKAKQMILYALIGLIICALAEIITAFVSNTIREANQNAYTSQTIISKEVYENHQIN